MKMFGWKYSQRPISSWQIVNHWQPHLSIFCLHGKHLQSHQNKPPVLMESILKYSSAPKDLQVNFTKKKQKKTLCLDLLLLINQLQCHQSCYLLDLMTASIDSSSVPTKNVSSSRQLIFEEEIKACNDYLLHI